MNPNPALPIAEFESETLELKSLAALAELATIARAAVAMLNAQGGEVWIGIKEGAGKNEVEPITGDAEAARERRRLQDHLLDVIEPVPQGREISVTAEPIGSGPEDAGRVLRVSLTPIPERRPYAFRRHGGRHFVRRFGDRIVPMSRDEIVQAIRHSHETAVPEGTTAQNVLQAETKELAAQDRFWIGLEPERAGDLDLRRLRETGLLADPTLSGTPRGGFNFTAAGYHGAPKLLSSGGKAALKVGDAELSLRLLRSGGVRFEAALREGFRVGRVPFVEADRLLSPEALLGYPVSVLRLAGTLLREPSLWRRLPGGDVWAALAITGLRGWGLLPGNLGEWPRYRYQISRFQDQDLLLQEPLRFTLSDLRERPDECAKRLVERVYDAFGIDLLPAVGGALLSHAGLPALEPGGYSRWVRLDLGGGDPKAARLRADNLLPNRFEWETRDGDLIPADSRWVRGWRYVR
jgi:hypothetical protein